VNGALVSGKSVVEIQRMLNGCGNHISLELMRCRRMTPTSSDMSQSSPFPTPTSPLTTDEFDPPDPPELLRKSTKLPVALNNSEPDMTSSRDSCSQLGRRVKENKSNFLDKAVSAITRPFLRSRQPRTTRGAHSKSAFIYVGNSNAVVDDLAAVSSSGQNIAAMHKPDNSTHKDKTQSLPRMKIGDAGRGTWPKYRARAAYRPSVLPLYTAKQSSSADDDTPLLPKPTRRGIEVQRSESARHHRPQISDSVVDYIGQIDSPRSGQKSSASAEMADSSLALYRNVCTMDSITPMRSPHYAGQFPDQTAEHRVTVISHFPGHHVDSEMVSYGAGHMNYTRRPVLHASAFSSAVGQHPTDNQPLQSSDVMASSPPSKSQQPSLARYTFFIIILIYYSAAAFAAFSICLNGVILFPSQSGVQLDTLKPSHSII